MKALDVARFDNPLDRRVAKEINELLEIVNLRPEVYFIREEGLRANGLPQKLLVTMRVPSIVALASEQRPIIGYEHLISIEFPKGYPSNDAKAICIAKSPLFHPNVGHAPWHNICYTASAYESSFLASQLLLYVTELIQYKIYFAEMRSPFPEDAEAAKWVREIAEPNGWVKLEQGILYDPSASRIAEDLQLTEAVVIDELEIAGSVAENSVALENNVKIVSVSGMSGQGDVVLKSFISGERGDDALTDGVNLRIKGRRDESDGAVILKKRRD